MKRLLLVPSEQEALRLMKAMLAANKIDNELEVDDPASENPNYFIKFGWFSRDKDEDDRVGCPCFVCDFRGVLPTQSSAVHGIVYVKVFATRTLNMTKMHLVEGEQNFNFDEIKDGEAFMMRDEAGRYERETFIFSKGLIVSQSFAVAP